MLTKNDKNGIIKMGIDETHVRPQILKFILRGDDLHDNRITTSN